MDQQKLFESVPVERLALQSKEDLIEFIKLQQKVNDRFQREIRRLQAQNEEFQEKTMLIEDQYIVLKNKFFGKSSEKEPTKEDSDDSSGGKKAKKKRVQLPSQRYPDAPLIERTVEFQTLPNCSCCGAQMADSGMTEDSEFVTVIPQQYLVIRQKRQKVRCSKCYGDMKTAPAPPRIKSGSAYSDEMMVDVSLTKYCDLIPIERYTKIAARLGVEDLPPQSLIECSHYVADHVKAAYEKLKTEIVSKLVLHADETPHRMLEGDKKSNWYLWGFSTPKTSYFEIHDTRSGEIASELLKDSKCEYLISDIFSGYGKAVRQTNEYRQMNHLPKIKNVYCNAHARRRFKEAKDRFPDEAKFFIDQYKEIYKLEDETKGKPPDEILKYRETMAAHFEEMKNRAMIQLAGYSTKSSIGRAMSYFFGNYNEFTLFLKNAELPIDNNPQERLLRNPVIGRKTWYGTHSKRGAETAAVLFSLVESCKLNKVNPRIYFKNLVQDLHKGIPAYTPAEFAAR